MTRKNFEKVNLRKLTVHTSYIILTGIIILLLVKMFSYSKTDEENDDTKYQKEINKHYYVYAPIVPKEVDFAGESMPVKNFDVRESLDYEILKTIFWHSESILYLKRATRYFPIIEPILEKNGVPDDFKYLCVTESGLRNAVSPAGAEGFWQFLESTGKSYGLVVNSEIDERYDLEKSTQAACEYLKDAKRKFGTWTLAAASYNVGQGRLNKSLKTQKVKSFYDLRLNRETSRYIYRIVAYKLIFENPRNYGFIYREEELYPEIHTQVVQVDSTITDLVDFAQIYSTNYKIIKMLNPWLRSNCLTNKSGKTYNICIPKGNGRSYDYFKNKRDSLK